MSHRGSVFSYHWRHENNPYIDDDIEACNVFFVWEMMRPLLKGVYIIRLWYSSPGVPLNSFYLI